MTKPSSRALKNDSSERVSLEPASMIRLLGPVDVMALRETVPLSSGQARTMLAALAVRPGQVLSTETLIDAMWGSRAPRTAPHALHVHASTLRKLVPDDVPLVGRPGGYVLQVGPGRLDADRFEELAARGRAELASGQTATARTLLREALGLWRGPALADVPWERFAELDVRRWEELRNTAQEDLIDADLAAGHHAEAVADLETLVREQPFRERRWGQLMIALYRSRRQAEALDRHQEIRNLLAEQLGVDPSPPLRALEEKILRHDDSLEAAEISDGIPVTFFASGSGGRLAYQIVGDGPITLVLIPGVGGNLEIRWEEPSLSRFCRRLARSARLVLFDKRGTGLSDRETAVPTLQDETEDVLAVMDAVGITQAVLLGVLDGGAIGLLTAARHPSRITGVITYASFAAGEMLGSTASRPIDSISGAPDRGLMVEDVVPTVAPSRVDDVAFTRWMGRYLRMAVGVGGAAVRLGRFHRIDIRPALPDVDTPVLALHREDDRWIPSANARYIAEQVENGQFEMLRGDDNILWAGDVDAIAERIERFLAQNLHVT